MKKIVIILMLIVSGEVIAQMIQRPKPGSNIEMAFTVQEVNPITGTATNIVEYTLYTDHTWKKVRK